MEFDTLDKWFKKAEDLTKKAQTAAQTAADTAQKQAAELQRSASSQLGGSKLNSREKHGRKELEFVDGLLGFTLEGTAVASVQRGSQAEKLGVERGDRLVAVAGYDVPAFEEGDIEGEQQIRKLIKKWMKEMPRPSILHFTNEALLSEKEGAVTQVKCNAGHYLKVCRKKENFCDVCQAIGTQYRSTGKGCDWDECRSCFHKKLAELPEAPWDEKNDLPKGEGLAWSLDSDDDAVEDSDLAARIEAALGDDVSEDDWTANIDMETLLKEPTSSEKAPSPPPAVEAACEPTQRRISDPSLPPAAKEEEVPAEAEENVSPPDYDWEADVVGNELVDELEVAAAEAVIEAEESIAATPQVAASSETTSFRSAEVDEACQEPLREMGGSSKWALELQDARHSWAQASASLEAERKQSALLRKKVGDLKGLLAAARDESKEMEVAAAKGIAAARDENKELLLASKHGEAATQRAVATEARADELAKEVEKLKAEAEDLRGKATTASERASATELRFDSFMRELTMVRKAHDAEVELMKREHQEQEKKQRERLEEQAREQAQKYSEKEEKAAEETREAWAAVEVAKRETAAQQTAVETAKAEASAALVEAAAARRRAEEAEATKTEAIKAVEKAKTPGGEADGVEWPKEMAEDAPKNSEVATLYDRINLLERRCCYLQGKLNSRPLAKGMPGSALESGLMERPTWEAWLAAKIGSKSADLVVFVYTLVELWLRNFTQRLLRRDMWLWVFYVHLLVLYSIAGSCTAETWWSSDPSNPVEIINAEMSKAGADLTGKVSGGR